MKLCFIFINLDDCKKVEQFLGSQFNVERDKCLGYDTLSVPKKDYEQVITCGIQFINANNIQTACWITNDNQIMAIDGIPLLFAEIPQAFKNSNFLKKVASNLCNIYAKNFGRRLGETILVHYTPCYNVEFRIVRNDKAMENHELYTEEITKYILVNYHFFNYILVCDAYSRDLTLINRNHSVEWPTKRPH